MRIQECTAEIAEFLHTKHISIQGRDWPMYYIGLLLNQLNKNQPMKQPVLIAQQGRGLDRPVPSDDTKYVVYITEQAPPANAVSSNTQNDKLLTQYCSESARRSITYKGFTDPETHVKWCWVQVSHMENFQMVAILVAATITRMMPALYTDKNQIREYSQIMREIIDAPTHKVEALVCKDCYVDFDEIARQRHKRQLAQCAKYMHKHRQEQAKQRLDRCKSQAEDLMTRYLQAIQQLNEAMALMNMPVDDGYVDAFIDFLTNNKVVEIQECSESKIFYDIVGYLDVYDLAQYENTMDNPHAYIHSALSDYSRQVTRQVLDDIFVHRKYRIRVVSTMCFLFDHRNIIDFGYNCNWSSLTRRYPDRAASPHAGLYKCKGSYEALWNEALDRGDNIGAVQASLAFAQSLNWMDAGVCQYFFQQLRIHRCIEDQQGNIWTLCELLNQKVIDFVERGEASNG